MSENTIFVGAGAGIVGLLLGYVIGGPDTDDLVKEVSKQVSSSAAETSAASAEQMAAMDTRIAGLEKALATSQEGMDTRIAGLEGVLAASQESMVTKLDDAVTSLSARIDTMTAELGRTVAESGSAQTEKVQTTLNAGIEKLQGSISEISMTAAATSESQESSEAAAPVPAPIEIEGAGVGETELLMEGAVRVFVSSINREDMTARVAVNGLSMQKIGSYHDVEFKLGSKSCTLLLDDIVEGHLQMSANCEE